jgi:ribosomal protein S18 acetylase RimI-like enzyme
MEYSIRELQESDIKETVATYMKVIHPAYISYGEITEGFATSSREFSPNVTEYFEKFITNSLNTHDRQVYVALVDEQVIGFVCMEVKHAEAKHNECWITDLGVTQPFRHVGVATALMHKAYAYGEEHQVAYFFLESGYDNHDAHSLFEHEDFVPLNVVFMKKANLGSLGL